MRLLVHWLTVTFAEVPPAEDFSSQLSSLRLGKYSVHLISSSLISSCTRCRFKFQNSDLMLVVLRWYE